MGSWIVKGFFGDILDLKAKIKFGIMYRPFMLFEIELVLIIGD
jgi:hypothetical protein